MVLIVFKFLTNMEFLPPVEGIIHPTFMQHCQLHLIFHREWYVMTLLLCLSVRDQNLSMRNSRLPTTRMSDPSPTPSSTMKSHKTLCSEALINKLPTGKSIYCTLLKTCNFSKNETEIGSPVPGTHPEDTKRAEGRPTLPSYSPDELRSGLIRFGLVAYTF